MIAEHHFQTISPAQRRMLRDGLLTEHHINHAAPGAPSDIRVIRRDREAQSAMNPTFSEPTDEASQCPNGPYRSKMYGPGDCDPSLRWMGQVRRMKRKASGREWVVEL